MKDFIELLHLVFAILIAAMFIYIFISLASIAALSN